MNVCSKKLLQGNSYLCPRKNVGKLEKEKYKTKQITQLVNRERDSHNFSGGYNMQFVSLEPISHAQSYKLATQYYKSILCAILSEPEDRNSGSPFSFLTVSSSIVGESSVSVTYPT